MAEAKDITPRFFGLVIAYLLPGFACALTISFWWAPLRSLLDDFLKSKSDVGSFLYVLILSLLLGLLLKAIRWAIYGECWLMKHKIPYEYFVELAESDRLLALHAFLDENFGYHQFYGSLSLVIPFFSIAVLRHLYTHPTAQSALSCRLSIAWGIALICFLVEIVVVCAAHLSGRIRYLGRIPRPVWTIQPYKLLLHMGKTAEQLPTFSPR